MVPTGGRAQGVPENLQSAHEAAQACVSASAAIRSYFARVDFASLRSAVTFWCCTPLFAGVLGPTGVQGPLGVGAVMKRMTPP